MFFNEQRCSIANIRMFTKTIVANPQKPDPPPQKLERKKRKHRIAHF
jgi:hypothetical protein